MINSYIGCQHQRDICKLKLKARDKIAPTLLLRVMFKLLQVKFYTSLTNTFFLPQESELLFNVALKSNEAINSAIRLIK